MNKKQWKLSWQRARLNKRNCEIEGHEFYKDSNTNTAASILVEEEFRKILGEKDYLKMKKECA